MNRFDRPASATAAALIALLTLPGQAGAQSAGDAPPSARTSIDAAASPPGDVSVGPGALDTALGELGDALARDVELGPGVRGRLVAPMRGGPDAVLDALATSFALSVHDDGATLRVDPKARELVRFVSLRPDAMRRVRMALAGVEPVEGLRVHLRRAGVLLVGDRGHVDALEAALLVEARRAAGERVSASPGTRPPDQQRRAPATDVVEPARRAPATSIPEPESTPASLPARPPAPSPGFPTDLDQISGFGDELGD